MISYSYPEPEQALSKNVVVSLSGGQDSTTCLYWAKRHWDDVAALAFDYGQRHRIELEAAQAIAKKANVPLKILPVAALSELGGNSLTDSEIAVSSKLQGNGLPNSFVPGRNVLFMTLLAAYAYQLGAGDLVTGVCQTDFSGYPDCRRDTMDSLEQTLSLGMEFQFKIHTPLMWLNKAETVALAADLDGCLEALSLSHTCYNGARPPCGECPACVLRARGFAEAGIEDPLMKLVDSSFN